MIGLPGETDEDIDECVKFVGELSKICPIALGVAPFCAKRNTPLDRMPYAGVARVDAKLDRLRRGLRGRADVRAVSAKWAWIEYVLAQGGEAEGLALVARRARRRQILRLSPRICAARPSPRRQRLRRHRDADRARAPEAQEAAADCG